MTYKGPDASFLYLDKAHLLDKHVNCIQHYTIRFVKGQRVVPMCEKKLVFPNNYFTGVNKVVLVKVSKGAKIRNRYNQVPHLTQHTNGKVTSSQLDTTNPI